ncbi:MAG TPA: hypothetical protein VMK42_03850 [Anaeromyxobacteraceae bacterium]|nr:hypothetical protein [Anaeromyxobacteraceae bacterium]
MRPWEIVERARVADGTELVLARRGDEWVVRAGGRVLMSSRQHGSEDALSEMALDRVSGRTGGGATVLIGGLGLGYTLRAALDRLGPESRAVVAEISPELVAWNRGPLAHLAGRPLEDPRVRLQVGDVAARIDEAHRAFDAVLLDVDNSPSSMVLAGNDRLYGERGVRSCLEALKYGGVLGVWSAGPDDAYRQRLARAGFQVEARVVPASGPGSGGARHTLFLARRPAPREGAGPPTPRRQARGSGRRRRDG